ncbi:ASCH domain-containing protein [Cronobacter sakazakii]
MKAISIRQPWAWLIVNGHKDIENRSWNTKYRGPVLIHAASTKPTPGEWYEAQRIAAALGIAFPSFEDMDKGGIVGVASITGTCQSSSSPWFFGPVGFTLADAKPLPWTPMKGKLSFFETGITPEQIEGGAA